MMKQLKTQETEFDFAKYDEFLEKTKMTFEEAYIKYYQKLNWFILTMVKDKEKAEDFTIETFMKSLHKIDKYTPDPLCSYRTWLFTLGRNLVKDAMNVKAKRQHISLQDELGEKSSKEDLFQYNVSDIHTECSIKEQKISLIYKVLDELDEIDRKVIIMRDLQNHNYNDIGIACNMSTNSAKCKVFFVRNVIKNKLKDIFKYIDLEDAREDLNWTY